jgi:hypothetical protein
VIFVVAILTLALAAAAAVSILRWRARRRTAYTPIPLVFPMNSGIAWESTMSPVQVQPAEPAPPSSFAPPAAPPVRASGERSGSMPLSVDRDSQVPATSETVRFVRPTTPATRRSGSCASLASSRI